MRYGHPFFLFILAISINAAAVTPQFWENFTQDELIQGTLTRVSVNAEGKLFLAPSYEMFYDTGQPYIFSMVRDKAGNLYLGTGHEGKVFRVDPQGKGSVYFQSKELDIFALALDASDALYVGTSPDGKVYKVMGPNQSTEFCNPEDKYIWSMAFDGSGNLYVGTGGRGLIVKVDRGGKKSVFYDTNDSHIMSLAWLSSGDLLAGTAPGGAVLQINQQGKAFTLLDTPMDEVRSLTVDRFGTIYAVAASAKAVGGSTKPDRPASSGATLSALTVQTSPGGGEKSGESAGSTPAAVSAPGSDKDSTGSRSSIYSISKEGGAETAYTSKDQMVYDASIQADGSLLAATGGKGRLLSVSASKQVVVVTDSPEEEVTCILSAGEISYAAGSNRGKVYRLLNVRAESGSFESKPLDAKAVATWGRISWRFTNPGGGTLEVFTRTGNTQLPDSSWSDWSPAYKDGQTVSSPRARYLQWKATFKRGAGRGVDALERLSIAYVQHNLRPQVTSITVLPSGVALQKTPSLPGTTLGLTLGPSDTALNSPRERGRERQALAPRQVLQPGAQAFTWKASDDNDDSLEYSIYFKGEGESDWKLLEKGLTDTFYTLDGAALPDGSYSMKVVASDAPSNAYGKFLIGELASKPFVISNSTPLVEISGNKLQGKRAEIQFRSRVTAGRIQSAEFSLDGGEWFLLSPVDGIADSLQEDYQFATPELATGEHMIGIRSSDANGNTGTAKVVVKMP